jgi:hypothetical protein
MKTKNLTENEEINYIYEVFMQTDVVEWVFGRHGFTHDSEGFVRI